MNISPFSRLQELYQILYRHFGPQGWWPLYNKKTGDIEYRGDDYSFPKNEEEAFEIAVGAILTQNTTWKNVEKALIALHERKLLTLHALRDISSEQLATIIRSSGYHRQKAKKLKQFVAFLDSGKPMTRENLLTVWGIGPETADSISLYAYQQPVFVIDAYTKRIMERLGSGEKTYPELQHVFMTALPSDSALFNEYHALLVALGKTFCKKKDPFCEECPLRKQCTHFLRKRSAADGER